MVGRSRGRLADQAIWYFLRQDYSPRELVIVDDGDDATGDLLSHDPRIHYVHVLGHLSPGGKRNLACQHARGDVIAHWDDDVWYSPRRLSAQVAHLESSRGDLSALTGVLHYQPRTGRVWCHRAETPAAVRVPGATLAYRRRLWREHRFSESSLDEISPFLRELAPARVQFTNGSDLAVTVLPGRSTGRVNPSDRRWEPRPFSDLGRLLDSDIGFYAGDRSAVRAPPSRHKPAPITLAATFMVYDGYGSMAEYLAVGMAGAGADVHVAPFRIDHSAMMPEFQELLRRSRPDPDGIVLCHSWWGENLAPFGSARDLFVKTAWETSQLPADWPARLNHATAVIVPSRFTARVFQRSGVRVPIEVVHEGVDPTVYDYIERPVRTGLTTLVVGVLAPRKNFRQAIAAWKLAFAGDPDARLILKARFQLERYVPDDPRITVVDTNEPTRGIAHWYRKADVLLALGNEGFGLPLIEGMATGLPAVALDAEAQGDVCAEAAGMVLPVHPARWEEVNERPFGASGVRAVPDVPDAARQLRWVADHRNEAAEMGRRASSWARFHRNVWDLGPATVAAIERHARSPRPIRPTFAVWVPPTQEPLSFRYYCDDFLGYVGKTRAYSSPPSAWRSHTLHIQHRPGAIDSATLARHVQAAQHSGTAVVVTEHHVGDHAEAWEQRADVLVALDTAAAARLRGRWTSKRVEVIPPGCPSWRAATRASGGRVVAVLGDATLELRDRGQRRVVQPPASAEALARRLNQEADVIVIKGEMPALGLAATALASGVPVVTAAMGESKLEDAAFICDDISEGVVEVLQSRTLRARLAAGAEELCGEWSWSRVAAMHHALWRTLA